MHDKMDRMGNGEWELLTGWVTNIKHTILTNIEVK